MYTYIHTYIHTYITRPRTCLNVGLSCICHTHTNKHLDSGMGHIEFVGGRDEVGWQDTGAVAKLGGKSSTSKLGSKIGSKLRSKSMKR